MKKQGMLNSHIAEVLSRLGHTDTIVIADCGLPIPDKVKRIDISLKQGDPSFIETIEAILEDMVVEKATLASEIVEENSAVHSLTLQQLGDAEINYVSHEKFKELTKNAKAVIRTGEVTPYANIIFHAGVTFS
ncbi:D-ribose pyranase [Metabacillus litoralis]|uniref:D-ribose pyranase n=1 Tax=Metabacillus litoralis TaxID=152268 RepID=A0A5C6W241_9BACI|nr:D-ribose pyranase [Metabacillus litoralis]TXC90990.1 D-ribose pyranase [Metabacillus litoralis]